MIWCCFWYKISTNDNECRIHKGNRPTRVGPDNHIEVRKITEGGPRVIIGWHVRNVFCTFSYIDEQVFIFYYPYQIKKDLIISNQQLCLIIISKSE